MKPFDEHAMTDGVSEQKVILYAYEKVQSFLKVLERAPEAVKETALTLSYVI